MSNERKREAFTPAERRAIFAALERRSLERKQEVERAAVRDVEAEIAGLDAYEAQIPAARWREIAQERERSIEH